MYNTSYRNSFSFAKIRNGRKINKESSEIPRMTLEDVEKLKNMARDQIIKLKNEIEPLCKIN